ncbi:type III-A CRISPR-associated protein Cas10/Csm1 [bacterium]|nr:type III-A CRISPR-associated protein Cas10/Csm1 [Gammaproteobacteria bacterium]NCQ34951.1 type III-A CRISPR-associated protein Cas10/Csm1 [bacterium]PIX83097.1 MAG: type III-A CRISPR-associated protein Cas10/Csm1 [Nitrospirae bacterium CG_4_10_14_3_um_filter_70_108]
MGEARLPTRDEVVLGALLHDIGKLMQRAHGTVADLPERSREMDNVLCPVREGRYSHKHILWTDAFFEWLEGEGLAFPQGIDRQQVRDFANFHHAPDRHPVPAMGWLSAEADRLASGLDRKPKEHDYEVKHGWDAFKREPLASLFDRIDLGEGKAAPHVYDLAPLGPGEVVEPRPKSEWDAHPGAMDYRVLWDGFKADFTRLCREGTGSVRLFTEGLLGLLERYTWAIPSSTIDIPDISLFDHTRVTAAIAACGHASLGAAGGLADEGRVRDRSEPRYRVVAGDLSGIQKAIFKLASEGVSGLARTLRARSFYLGALTDAAALWLLHDLGLPSCCRLQAAGGRFLLLVPATAQVEGRVANVRDRIRRWLLQRYYGELTLHLVVGAPFAGEAFLSDRFSGVVDEIDLALQGAKLAPPLPEGGAVLDWVQFTPEGGEVASGACTVCGQRPAAHRDERGQRCDVCHQEAKLGRWLPSAAGLGWAVEPIDCRHEGRRIGETLSFFSGEADGAPVHLAIYRELPRVQHHLLRVEAFGWQGSGPVFPQRFLANHCPRFGEAVGDFSPDDPWFAGLSDEAREDEGDSHLLTFEHIAHLAQTVEADRSLRGKPYLAALKADVDHLGLIFSLGLEPEGEGQREGSVSRFAALSRQLDLFFTGQLQQVIRDRFPATYTLYAGGDDLFLIGPWRQTIDLAVAMNDAFRAFTGHNPNVHLSAAVELFKPHEPLRRVAERVETRLKAAKEEGRDRLALFGEVRPWSEVGALLHQGEQLAGWIREARESGGRQAGSSVAMAYRLFEFRDMARRVRMADRRMETHDLAWRSALTYAIARNLIHEGKAKNGGELAFYERLRGDGGEALEEITIPLHLALYASRG